MRFFLWFAACAFAHAQQPDSQLAAEIAKIQAIDNHAHPVRVTAPGEKDDEFDALPVDAMEPYSEPIKGRPEFSEVIDAWRAMFRYPYLDRAPGHLKIAGELKRQTIAKQGDAYPAWVLDQMGVEVMVANRVSMGRGIAPPRFRWVPYADALIFPLSNDNLANRNPDRKVFFPLENRLRARYLKECGYDAIPDSFDDYLRRVVTATLERHKAGGAIAEKFEAAYLRPLNFEDPSRADAERVYRTWTRSIPPDADYKVLQDYLFRYIAGECGRLGMAVHFHSAAGAGGYFDIAGVHPTLIEPLLNDARLRKTNFVFIHGGWPFTHELTALLTKPNAYLDFSEQTFDNYPRAVSEALRDWLGYVPEKVMFATDAYPFSEEMGWEEAGWIAARTGRRALVLALSGMLADGEISRARALELARMVLRDNARRLYKLP